MPTNVVAEPIHWPAAGQAHDAFAVAGSAAVSAPDNPDPNAVLELQSRVRELERELPVRERAAFERGLDEGRTTEARNLAARVEPQFRNLAAAVSEIAGLRSKVRAEAEQDVIRLAVAIARRILHRELTVDPDALLGVVMAALGRIDSREITHVRAHPGDVPAIQKHLAAAGAPPRIELIGDPVLEPGSVVLETSRGNLDASVSTQLAEIERGLIDLVWSRR
jgi:flagellar assembly protein FliH